MIIVFFLRAVSPRLEIKCERCAQCGKYSRYSTHRCPSCGKEMAEGSDAGLIAIAEFITNKGANRAWIKGDHDECWGMGWFVKLSAHGRDKVRAAYNIIKTARERYMALGLRHPDIDGDLVVVHVTDGKSKNKEWEIVHGYAKREEATYLGRDEGFGEARR